MRARSHAHSCPLVLVGPGTGGAHWWQVRYLAGCAALQNGEASVALSEVNAALAYAKSERCPAHAKEWAKSLKELRADAKEAVEAEAAAGGGASSGGGEGVIEPRDDTTDAPSATKKRKRAAGANAQA